MFVLAGSGLLSLLSAKTFLFIEIKQKQSIDIKLKT